MISKIIEEFYQKLCEVWELNNSSLPKVPYNKNNNSDFYIGDRDKDGYVQWKIIKVTKPVAKNSLFEELGIKLHDDIYDLLNSWYFLDICGFIGEDEITLHNITPETIPSVFLRRRYESLAINNERVRYVQIGDYNTSEESLFLCIDNDTGEIVCYDSESMSVHIVSESMEELIQKLTPRY